MESNHFKDGLQSSAYSTSPMHLITTMAESKGVEPFSAFLQNLGLANQCYTALPTFRIYLMAVGEGIEPPAVISGAGFRVRVP